MILKIRSSLITEKMKRERETKVTSKVELFFNRRGTSLISTVDQMFYLTF